MAMPAPMVAATENNAAIRMNIPRYFAIAQYFAIDGRGMRHQLAEFRPVVCRLSISGK
jgi:hypothetical protein